MTPCTKRRLWYIGGCLLLMVAVGVWLLGPKQRYVISKDQSIMMSKIPPDFTVDELALSQLVKDTARQHNLTVSYKPTISREKECQVYWLVHTSMFYKHHIEFRIYMNTKFRSVDGSDDSLLPYVQCVYTEILNRPFLFSEPQGCEGFVRFREGLARKTRHMLGLDPDKPPEEPWELR